METTIETVWSKSKLLVKGFIIAIIVLLLQIPAAFVQDIVRERQQRQEEAVTEVSSKWAASQTIWGPVLVLPYWKAISDSSNKIIRAKHFAYFLPENLSIDANVSPQEKHRGIYKVILYSSSVNMSGNFSFPDLKRLNIFPNEVVWNEAVIKLPVTDNKGLNEEIKFELNDTALVFAPQTSEDPSIKNALQINPNWNSADDVKPFSFSSSFTINGSQQILFTPLGKNTTVRLQSSWAHPSFVGDALPQSTNVKDTGFSATWKSAAHRRSFPQQWQDGAFVISNINPRVTRADYASAPITTTAQFEGKEINASAFGMNLFVPVNAYQKTMRSVKYAALVILLTFAAFFLIETNNKKSVHPFQYGLIGVALVLFYTLLLSFSEYVSFNLSYAIASLFTIGLIGWFVKSVLASAKYATILTTVLVLLYVYLFTILQLQDYSLLIGSIGLFISLGVVMYFSRKFRW